MKIIAIIVSLLMSQLCFAAVTPYTSTKVADPIGRSMVVKWAAVVTGNTGTPVTNPAYRDRTIQVDGTFGGGTCTIEGSNDGITWYTLNDSSAAPLTFTTAGLKKILATTTFIRPNVTAGAASLTINLLMVAGTL